MKKPQYTRQTKPRVKRWQYTPETWIEIYTTQLNSYLTQRDFLLSPSTTAEVEKEQIKNKRELLVYKKQLNKEIKDHNKRIRFYKKKHSRQPKPLDIFEHCHTATSVEDLVTVKNTPAAVCHLTRAVADYENSPLKGLFSWYAFTESDYNKPGNIVLCVAILDNPECHSFRIDNRCHAYLSVYRRLTKEHSFKQFSLKTL